jgi:hypothetical protein
VIAPTSVSIVETNLRAAIFYRDTLTNVMQTKNRHKPPLMVVAKVLLQPLERLLRSKHVTNVYNQAYRATVAILVQSAYNARVDVLTSNFTVKPLQVALDIISLAPLLFLLLSEMDGYQWMTLSLVLPQ